MAASTSSDKVTLYIDKLSQPSRAVLWYCMNEEIPDFEVKLVQIRKLETRSEEFKKVNRSGKVPAIVDGDFSTGESCSIVRYLSEKYGKWNLVPKDLKARTVMNAVLDEHHNTTRLGAARVFWFDYLTPAMSNGAAPKPHQVVLSKDAHTALRQALSNLEARLTDSNAYLTGNSVTFADMLSYSELKQLDLVPFDFSSYPAVVQWMKLMAKIPNHDKVFDVLEKLVAVASKRRAEAGKAKL